jgi:hypothetical protein
MEMSEVVEQAAPVEAPASTGDDPVPGAGDDIQGFLDEYERANPAEPSTATNEPAGDAPQLKDDAIDSFLQDLNTDGKRVNELQGELDGLRAEMHRKAELEAFDKYSSELQAKLPEYLPDDYARTQMLSKATQDPNLIAAWDYRKLSDLDRRAADAEFKQLELLHAQITRDPRNDPRKGAALAAIERRGQQLGLMMNAPEILRRAERDIIKRANDYRPIDPDATADRAMVAAAVRDGRGVVDLKEPAPDFASMTDAEFNAYKRKMGF